MGIRTFLDTRGMQSKTDQIHWKYMHVDSAIDHWKATDVKKSCFKRKNGIFFLRPHVPLLLSRFSRVRLCATPRRQPTRLPCPWDSPGKNTGVGCHCLLQCMKVKSESEVAQSSLTLCNPVDCSLPGFSVRGSFQARVPLAWLNPNAS